MNRSLSLFSAIVLLTAASSASCSSSDEATAPCAERAGTYHATWVEESGNCGYMPDETVTMDSQPKEAEEINDACTGTIVYSQDNCEATHDLVCAGSTGFTVTRKESETWDQDGSSGTSTVTLQVIKNADQSVQCSSVYRVTIERL